MILSDKLDQLLLQAKIAMTKKQKQQLLAYLELLNKWNKAYNLTSVRDPETMLVKHIIDSVVVNTHLTGSQFIDVGTGPGLPGIPLAIIRPESEFTLLDSLGKRVRFLKQVQFELELNNIIPVQSRVEAYHDKLFDGVISRAFSSLKEMLNWCEHLPKQNGLFYALKGVYPEEELIEIPQCFFVNSVIKLVVPELNADRHLIILSKKQ